MEQGAYFARVTGTKAYTVFADEDALWDAQMRRLFADRDKSIAARQLEDAKKQRRIERLAIQRARRFHAMINDCLYLTATAVLAVCVYIWGLYAAIAAVTGCSVAIGCRVINYIHAKGGTK